MKTLCLAFSLAMSVFPIKAGAARVGPALQALHDSRPARLHHRFMEVS